MSSCLTCVLCFVCFRGNLYRGLRVLSGWCSSGELDLAWITSRSLVDVYLLSLKVLVVCSSIFFFLYRLILSVRVVAFSFASALFSVTFVILVCRRSWPAFLYLTRCSCGCGLEIDRLNLSRDDELLCDRHDGYRRQRDVTRVAGLRHFVQRVESSPRSRSSRLWGSHRPGSASSIRHPQVGYRSGHDRDRVLREHEAGHEAPAAHVPVFFMPISISAGCPEISWGWRGVGRLDHNTGTCRTHMDWAAAEAVPAPSPTRGPRTRRSFQQAIATSGAWSPRNRRLCRPHGDLRLASNRGAELSQALRRDSPKGAKCPASRAECGKNPVARRPHMRGEWCSLPFT